MRIPGSGSVTKALVTFPSEKPIDKASRLVDLNVYCTDGERSNPPASPAPEPGMRTSGSPARSRNVNVSAFD
jgi:hypothetical protein